MNDLTVQILLTAKDQATKVMKDLGRTVKGSAREAVSAYKRVERGAIRMAQRSGRAFRRMGQMARRAITGLPGLIGAALTGVGAMIGGALISAASDAEEVGSKFDVLFEDVAGSANDMADDLATALGRSRTDFRDYMATIQNVITPMGLVGEEGRDLSAQISALAVDLASFNNAADDEALIALRAALVGEAEPLRRFGVMLSQAKVEAEAARLGMGGLTGELSDQELVLARLSIITRDTQKAQGDAQRTADSYANSVKAMTSEAKDLSVEFGNRLIDSIMDVTRELGGTEEISRLLRVGFEFVTQAGIGVIQTFGQAAAFSLALIDRLGGVEGAAVGMGKGFAFIGDIVKSTWAAVSIVFVAFTNGLRTVAFAVEGLWGIVKVLAGLLGIGFLEAMRGVLFLVTKLVRGFDVLTAAIRDGVIWVLDQAMRTMQGFLRGMAEFLAMIPGMEGFANQMRDAASGIDEMRVALEGGSGGGSMMGQLLGDLGAVDLTIKDTQRTLEGFVHESWSGLADDAMEWAQDIADTGPVMAKAWETYVDAARDTWQSGGTLMDFLKDANVAIQAVMLEGAATTGKAVGEKTVEEIAAAVEAQKGALGSALQNAVDGAKAASGANVSTGGGEVANVGWMDAVAAGFKGISLEAQAAGQAVSTSSIAFDTMQDVGRTLASGMDNLVDGMVRGTQTMGQAWERVKMSVVSSIAQMVAQMLAMKAIGFFFPGGGAAAAAAAPFGSGGAGSVFPAGEYALGGTSSGVVQSIPFQAFAQGGVATKPTLGLFGENPFYKGEAFIPIPSGGKLPVEGGGGDSYNFHIHANDTRGFDDLLLKRGPMIVGMMEEATVRKRSYRKAIGQVGRS